MRTTLKDPECLLVARDPALVDAVQATALALGVAVAVVMDREELRGLWPGAGLRLVDPASVSRVKDLAPCSGETWVVGHADSDLLSASARLAAPALALPAESARLAEVLTHRPGPEPHARVIALVGGSGGVGTSSLAVGVALMTAKRGKKVAVIELDDCGGGLDLLLGLEASPGVRWNDLANASGELGQLDDQLVSGGGVSVLAVGRKSIAHPTPGALDAVLRSLGRTHDVVVVDAGDGSNLAWLGNARAVLVVAAHVRGVAAARMLAERAHVSRADLLVRTGPGSTLPAESVAEALGLPLVGSVRHDPAVPRLSGSGACITSSPARRFRRDVNMLVDRLLG